MLAMCLTGTLLTGIVHAQSGVWTTAASEGFTARAYHAATAYDGKIYAFGGLGSDDERVESVDMFDPSLNKWTRIATTGTFTRRLPGHASAEVGGKIYVFGGGDADKTVEAFDPVTREWTTPSTTGQFTEGLSATADVIDGKIYIVAGTSFNPRLKYLNRVEVFDPATGVWTTPATTGTLRARSAHSSAYLDGKLYIIGGYSNSTGALNTVDVLDVATNAWSTLATTGTFPARYGHTSTVVDGKIYVLGGLTSVEEVFMLDPVTSAWTQQTSTGTFTPRNVLSAVAIGGKIYAMGGDAGVFATTIVNVNEIYTPGATSAVHDIERSDGFRLAPNPTSGFVNVHGAPRDVSRVTVANAMGEVIFVLDAKESAMNGIDLTGVAEGVYFLRFSGASSTSVKRIIVR